ncbi:WAP four-disulfide core domain protein 13 [Phyllostomus hastatus]|uniref:WAP four-disulfide core domain protein 13 n=1 Tax=Phyllostomus hastatus TaxID=9423 RepID=UPI001E6847BB|nr:WAP four-disulfide core domain protein 13 [Phyllostomus hastatus]
MKLVLLLQLLLSVLLAPQLVPGSPKQHLIKYILEPPPCRVAPENCTMFCAEQEDCPTGLQCCSAFCGIIWPLQHEDAELMVESRLSSAEWFPSADRDRSGDPGVARKVRIFLPLPR